MASPSAGNPALKYGDVNIETPSPGEVKGLKLMKYRNWLSLSPPKKSKPKIRLGGG